jgi:pimeloyl-ACP methyl ester carboxylesterase
MNPKNILFTSVLAIFLALLFAGCKSSNFEEAECQFHVPAGMDIECGYLSVPEDRGQEDSPAIQLHVAIIHSIDPDPAPDPVVILHGGPGGYALDMLDYWLDIFRLVRRDHDLIILDQRGTGYSRPSLNCPEAENQWYQAWTENISQAETNQRYTEGLGQCYERLAAEGVDLAAYTSAANAADLEDLRQALGYTEWNLYGSSYGTRLALTTMRDFPAGIRSVILDSVYPPQVDLFATLAVNGEHALNLIFERCAGDPKCNQDHPDLKASFYQLADQLDAEPLAFRISHPITAKVYEVILNGDRLIWTFFNMLYRTDLVPVLARHVETLREGSTATIRDILSWAIFFDDFWSEGMYYSVQCTEEIPFGSPEAVEQANAAVTPRFLAGVDGSSIFQCCDVWKGMGTVPAVENQAVISEIPALILSGQFDPITPPAWGQLAAETLGSSQFLEFSGHGHGILGVGPDGGACSRQIVSDFLADPGSPVDASCLSDFELNLR